MGSFVEVFGEENKPNPNDENQNNAEVKEHSPANFFAKTLLWFGYGLVLTFAIAFGLPAIIYAVGGLSAGDMALYVMSGIGIVGILIFSIIIMIMSFKAKGFNVVTFTIYAILMGMALTPLFIIGQDPVGALGIVYSLAVTGGIFVIMGIIGVLSKGKIGMLLSLAMAFGIGSLVLAIVNIFMFSDMIYWIVSFGILLFFIMYVGIDFAIIQHHSDNPSNELAILCAFNLYTDFIVIFIRLLPIIIHILGNNN